MSSISVSVTSNSSKSWNRPINKKPSLLIKLQDSILRDLSREHEFVRLDMNSCVTVRQQVMSNFSRFLFVFTRKERFSSVTPTHLLKFNSLSELHELPRAFNPDSIPKQPSSLTNCSLGKLCRHFARSAVTWVHKISGCRTRHSP